MYTLCKFLYTTVFALLSAAPPYLQLYYHDVLRFSSDQIGLVLAIAPFIQSLACPFWTFLVDKRPKYHGAVMAVTSLVGGSAVMGIMAIGHYYVITETTNLLHLLQASAKKAVSNSTLVTMTSTLALTFAFFTLPNTSLVDSAVMKILGPNKLLYGEQRLWGSISTGLTILLVGELIDLTGSLDAMFWVFAVSTAAFIVCALMVSVEQQQQQPATADFIEGEYQPILLPDEREKTYSSITADDEEQQDVDMLIGQTSTSLFKPVSRGSVLSMARSMREEADERAAAKVNLGLAISRITSLEHSTSGVLASNDSASSNVLPPPGKIFKSPSVLCFLTTTLLFGVVLSMIVNFLFLFLSRDLHTPASWIGWTGPLGGVTELLCFCFSKQMTQYLGTTCLVIIAHVATMARCLAYTMLPPDSFTTNVCALLLQTLHGIGFGIFWATAVSEMDDLFPPEQRAVAQGILGALHQGLGTGLGAMIGGYLYEYYGAIWLFHSVIGLAVVSITIFSLGRLSRF